jgi:preprotein translocase subunit YajC
LQAIEFVIPSTDTFQLGTYLVGCDVRDRAGFRQTRNVTFEIVKQAPKSSSAFAVPGFSAPVARVKINTGVTSDGGQLGAEGISRLMQVGASLKVDVKGHDHTITVSAVTDDTVTLTISSDPMTITVNKGETVSVDVDGDGTNDIAVTYHKRFPPGGKHADLTFALTETPSVGGGPDSSGGSTSTPAGEQALKSGKAGLLVTVIVIVVIVVLGYFMLSKRKK